MRTVTASGQKRPGDKMYDIDIYTLCMNIYIYTMYLAHTHTMYDVWRRKTGGEKTSKLFRKITLKVLWVRWRDIVNIIILRFSCAISPVSVLVLWPVCFL